MPTEENETSSVDAALRKVRRLEEEVARVLALIAQAREERAAARALLLRNEQLLSNCKLGRVDADRSSTTTGARTQPSL